MIAKSFSFLECGVVSRVTNWTDSTYEFNSPHIDPRHPREIFSPFNARGITGIMKVGFVIFMALVQRAHHMI